MENNTPKMKRLFWQTPFSAPKITNFAATIFCKNASF
jgi:hypothetical protein